MRTIPCHAWLYQIACGIGLALLVASCNNSSDNVIKLVEERDSLRAANEQSMTRLKTIDAMMTTLNSALDSISVEEQMLFVSKNPEVQMSRNDALKNLQRFEAVVRNQQNRITELEAQLAEGNADANTMGIVSRLKAQIASKDAEISQLKRQLQDKDVNISQLRQYVETQRSQIAQKDEAIAELGRKTQSQTEALKRQDEVINNCYVLIGSKKDLKRKGILSKGKLVSEAILDKSRFAKVDIRKWREITFEAKRPRILTNMPSSSYTLTTKGDHKFTLNITNPTAFWSISNFLVIQSD